MNGIVPIALFLVGFVAGALLLWLFRAGDARTLRETVANRDARLEKLAGDLAELKEQRTKLEANLDGERRSGAEKLALFETAQQKLSDAFRALSAEALQTNNRSFLDLAKSQLEKFQETAKGDLDQRQQAITQTLLPVRESLEKVDAKIQEMEKSRSGAYAALHEQVRSLADGQSALRSETTNLVRALRQPTVRGRWGEIQLKRVVEMAGMVNHCDFVEQKTIQTDDGRLRPDVRVRLPGNKYIIVDAKAPLEAYLNAVDATDDEVRRGFLKTHAQNIRTHINNLSKKSYWEQFEQTPEFVVLFLPGEAFFSAALESDPGIIEMGVEQQVILATPTTLIALLRAVHYGWRQEAVAVEAKQISDLGKELYKRLADMSAHFFKLGSSLRTTVDFYNKAVGTLEARVLVSARKFKDLKALGIEAEIEPNAPVETTTRTLQAPEMIAVTDGLFPVPDPPALAEDQESEDQLDEGDSDVGSSNREAILDFNAAMPSPVLAETAAAPSSRDTSSDSA
ncbi:MAG: DNA recombination protein RmuC [Candidatus Eremiobacteraeota bacterium]|nr:DNA recombination protein RmuC [Candidatus Eremiobacteraeota bacterium]